jgi:hypothetical protein
MSDTPATGAATTETESMAYRIVVNGQPKTATSEILTYDDVVRLAFPNGEPNTIYRVTFRKAEHPHAGTLVEGQTVEIKEGTIFDVTPTGKS